jgi:ligand-binding sensor domain-containing protein/signal transduction histidine kinase
MWQCGAASLLRGESSSEFAVRFWRTEDDLPHNSVKAIAQTGDGYLWVGTRNGLVRFDGVRCVVFNRLNTPELASNRIVALAAGPGNELWIATDTGVTRLVGRKFEATPALAHIGGIQQLLATPDESLWIASSNGLFVLHGNSRFEKIEPLANVPVRSLARDSRGILWVGTTNGLWKFDAGKITAVAPLGATVTSLASGPDGVLWIAGDKFGLLQRTPGEEAPRRVWAVSAIEQVLPSDRGVVWMTKQGGELERLSIETSSATPVPLGVGAINCAFEDREGNLWIGTEDAGLAQVRRKTIRLYESKAALSVTEDAKGQIWATTESGEVQLLVRDRLHPVKIATGGPAGFVETICAARVGGLWVGTRFDGLFRWNGHSNSAPQKFAATIGITALFEDRQERLWVASGRDGVTLVDRGQQRTILSPEGEPFGEVSGFAQDNAGRVWIATRRRGIAEWTGAATRWLGNHETLREARLQCVYSDVEGNLWIGTTRGLHVGKAGKMFSVTSEHGLYDDLIYQVLEDFRGNFWFGSSRGIFRVAKNEFDELFGGKISTVYSTAVGLDEGMTGVEGVGGAQPTAWKAQDGKLLFATRRGLAVVDPASEPAATTFPVVIEEVRVDGDALLFGATNTVANVPADYHQLHVQFTGLTFAAPERTQFRYQLEGIDRDWNRAQPNRVATYPKLRAGEYRFRVMARNHSATWSEAPILLLRIAPRYWETGWFKAAVAAAILLAIALVWRDRVAKQRQWDAMRQQITRDLHDDLGSNIGSIALLSEALQRPTRSGTPPQELLKEINEISRQTLDAMRDAVWIVDPEKDFSSDLIARMKLLAESMLKGVAYEFQLNEAVGARKMPLPLKRGIVLMFKETLHNLVRHSGATLATIVVTHQSGRFGFEVRDNGKGFDPAGAPSGHGLKNLRHRAEKMDGTLTIESAPGQGTAVLFHVNLP